MTRKTIVTTAAGALFLMVLVPGVASGHHTNDHNEPFPKEVIVANGADAAIPTEVQGRVEVQQSGPWTVQLENDANDPVVVVEAPNEPFQYSKFHFNLPAVLCDPIEIPVGRTLEVQSVTVDLRAEADVEDPGLEPAAYVQVLRPDTAAVTGAAIDLTKAFGTHSTIHWLGSLTGLTLFAGELGGQNVGLEVCLWGLEEYGVFWAFVTVSGRLE